MAILSDFKLDIDYPYEVVTKENVNPKPVKVPYSDRKPRYKHYGKNIENFITAATDMDDKEKRERLTELICFYLKKSLIERNKESASDKKVIDDIRLLSKNRLEVNDEASFLSVEEFRKAKLQRGNVFPQKKKKKKKKKK